MRILVGILALTAITAAAPSRRAVKRGELNQRENGVIQMQVVNVPKTNRHENGVIQVARENGFIHDARENGVIHAGNRVVQCGRDNGVIHGNDAGKGSRS
ncbi:hypothetical protein B0H19DRAFT_715890 [Mycena capillaripes]|nr:hypothetical protein B0H19DRAFT_715890 [Mycena capillaripes]